MKIGIISDSHDHVIPLQKAVASCLQANVEAIFHAGDFIAPFSAKLLAPPSVPDNVPVYCVYGNNDGERKGLKTILPDLQDGPLRLTLGGKTIVMIHDVDLLANKDIDGADVVIFGHTHTICREERNGVLFLNPGECCGILTGRTSAAILDTDNLNFELIEL